LAFQRGNGRGGQASLGINSANIKIFTGFVLVQRGLIEPSILRILERPKKKDVLDALESCTIAHFACQGCADRIEPAKSALIIGREFEERLTVQDLDALNHDHGVIAYLSACSTAEIRAVFLAEESVHLASTFQIAGFRHVIGTLWGADDDAAVKVASKFYQDLLQRSDITVAQALHNAILCYRDTDNHAAISKWAPFIHLGC
jgi:CHAT domain-containing protein